MSRNAAGFNASNPSIVTSLVDARQMITHLQMKISQSDSEAAGDDAVVMGRKLQKVMTKYPTFAKSPSYLRFELFVNAAISGTCV
jgi:hypothetical protein